MLKKLKRRMKIFLRDLIINTLASSKITPRCIRKLIYKLYGMNIKTKNISPNCFFGGNNISIKAGTFVNYNCFFDNNGEIEIGENCNIAMGVKFITSFHSIGSMERRAGNTTGIKIHVGDGSWIGANAIILPGVKIGNGCIIGAGSVVTKDCEKNCIYVGNPAKKIRSLN